MGSRQARRRRALHAADAAAAADPAADRNAPTVAPTPTPTPVPTPYQDHFIAGDYIISPKVYNEFSPGNTGNNERVLVRASAARSSSTLFNLPWMLEGDYRQYQLPAQLHPVGAAGSARRAVT